MAEHDVERIKLPNADILHIRDATGAGRIVPAGTQIEFMGQTYTVGDGCEIFNKYDYNGNSGNFVAGEYSHAEGYGTAALADYSHAEGIYSTATGDYAHAEGFAGGATGRASHAEGESCGAYGVGSHAEGVGTLASGDYSHTSGYYSVAQSDYQTVIGKLNAIDQNDTYAFIIGNGYVRPGELPDVRQNAFAIDWNGLIYVGNSVTGIDVSTLPGRKVPSGTTVTYNNVTYTAGDGCEIFNDLSTNKAAGEYAHAEGSGTIAVGSITNPVDIGMHAEGTDTVACCGGAHAEGAATVASGPDSHSEGLSTVASGIASHAGGFGTAAASDYQTAIGKYNVSDSNDTYAFIIGNGTAGNARSNAFAIDWSGLIYVNNAATGVNVSTIVNHITINDVFGRGTKINSGSDMDSATYRVPGRYYVSTGSDAALINGCPSALAGGQLTVSYVVNGNNTNVLQEYILRTGTAAGITYKRIYYSSAWGEWKEYKSVTDFYSASKALTPGSGETIDLNDIGPGRFRVSSTSYTSQILHAPSDFTSSTLYFIESGMTVDSTNYMYQIIYPVADASTVYKRHCVAGTWSDWVTFRSLTESEKNAIPALVNEYKNLANPLDARGYMVQGTSFPYTKGGVTYTLNTDGSITVTGTATSTTVMRIPVTLEIGKTYVISGCPATGSSDTFSVQLRSAGGNDALAIDYGSGASYTPTTETNYDLCMRFQSGLVTGGRVFRPMVCLSDKWDVSKSFAPYKKSTVEITDELVALIDNGPKNIVNNKLTTKTTRGVTATTNADGSITITGADSDKTGESFVLVHDLSKPSATTAFTTWNKADKTKTYICPTVGDSRVRFQVITYESSSTYTTTASSDSNIVFTIPADRTYISFRIWIADSADFTSSPVTFYPMVCEKYMWDISTAFVPYKPVTESYTGSLSSTYVNTSSSYFTIYRYGPLCVARVLFVVTGTLTGSDKVSSSNIPGRFRPIVTTFQAMTARNADNWTTAAVNSVSVQVNTSGEIRLLSGANSSGTVYVNGTMTWMVTTPQ